MTLASELAQALGLGDRRALSKAITLVESTRPSDRESALELLSKLEPTAAHAFRIGVTGVPGAGKSTLIDALGRCAIAQGLRVAVLAVDPTSRDSGGSVLGDKTRMTGLSREQSAFIRPSPTLGVLGGTAGRTREVIVLCEAAGFDLVLVETVGVGQSEERVASMVDCVLLVLLAGAGDELSSMKRGVLEAADVIAFNKADGDRAPLVESDAAALRSSLAISRAGRVPEVSVVSALEDKGVRELWAALQSQHREAVEQGTLARRRAVQRTAWFEAALDDELRMVFGNQPELARAREAFEQAVRNGELSAPEAARRLVSDWLAGRHR